MQYLWYYLILINAAAYLLMRADKRKAKRHQWRIPETVLLGTGFLGGGIGATLGMLIHSHKTKKPWFSIGLPVSACLQFGFLAWFLAA